MLTVNCQSCGAIYKLSEDLYSRKAAGFGVVVTCRRCKNEIHVEAPDVAPANASPDDNESDDRPTLAPAASAEAASEQAEDADVKAKSAPPPRATAKATAPWPEAAVASPPAPAAAARAESPAPPPAAGATPKAESPAPPPAAQRPAPRPMAPSAKPHGTGPFVALSPGLLGAQRPEPLHDDFEAPVDSSDFINEPKRGASPKAPPVRRPADVRVKPPPAKSEQKAPPVKRTEPAQPLKFKEPPKPPKQKPREPARSDDVSDDLLSADVGFDGALPLEPEPPRILAPTSSALAAPPPEAEAEKESPKPGAVAARGAKPGPTSPSTSDARPRPSSAAKSSRFLPIALVSLGAAGAFGLAFRSQVPDGAEKGAGDNPSSAENSPPRAAEGATPSVPATPPPTEGEPAAPLAVSAAAMPTPTNTTPGATTLGTVPRAPSTPSPKETSEPLPSPAASTPKPGVTAPAGTAALPDPPKTAPEGPFDAEAARTALAGAVAQAGSCRKPGDPTGVAVVTITFSPSGRVTSANIAGPPFAGTPTGGCIAATLRRARVPAFEGDMVTVKKTVEIR